MDKRKILYLVVTWVFGLFLFSSGVMSLVNYGEVYQVYVKLGFPTWLTWHIGVAKILGVIMILWKKNKHLTEWAYAGFTFELLLAISAHAYAKDIENLPVAVVALLLCLSSYYLYRNQPSS